MNHVTPTPTRSIAMRPMSQSTHPSPSVACVGGMLRVMPEPDFADFQSPMPGTPMQETPPSGYKRASPEREGQTGSHSLLTQKQVRELRRLCRKTANRAEFEDRLIQVRQIASIAAMGTPAAKFFDPSNPKSGAALRGWVELHRGLGADWRDERPLPDNAIDELRQWDRGLKAWARLRFETPQVGASGADFGLTTPSRPPGFSPSQASITPYTGKSKAIEEEHVPFSSPISPEGMQEDLGQRSVASSVRSHFMESPVISGLQTPARVDAARRAMAEVSINRVGDTINVTVPSTMLSHSPMQAQSTDPGRMVARNDQENLHPTQPRKMSYLHAVNTAKSWRNNNVEQSRVDHTLTTDREIAFRSAAKNLFASKDNVHATTTTAPHQVNALRSEMDWARLRRPALKPMSVNNAVNGQPLGKLCE